ncbi:MAG TPA: DUF433 domain-containing protein [Candidatus Kapabacteria bacterium]|jgi:uncharacterized protein (DUF433 family)|nr:DUF433 domain-containing protein [Candidatus Kapabacteria bacterium]
METQIKEITASPEILGGTPVFRGTRVPFDGLLDYLEAGKTIDNFVEDYPSVTREQAAQALAEALHTAEHIASESLAR